MQERPAFLDSLNAGPWRGQTSAGAFPRDPVLEARLRLDDCASLAGLLVDLLGRERWELFFRTINTRPMGHTRYTLTGNGKIDRQLSKVVNHAWMGDGGGALSVADGEPWNTGYVDALELLADVDACFLAAVKPSGISCP